ncbi:hypothetical protein BIV57_01780 [Mangrovactinospora gilvigrisea]|uniref:L,D-transpeptidase n=1 Tax=Mangrovactinospora gilvigrisea TaxID=1428644 RepID=A0A1J7C0J9_9ACTN|nr:hypothetical protein [Mangrovactinospora gilvigrisea]OIV39241.1 hypothetical protein BIV57_01780 [Mangrovactinospora gilvigrisea]
MRIGSGAIVAGLTVAAMAVLGGLAYQAQSSAPDRATYPKAGASASASPGASKGSASKGGSPSPAPVAVPADSGTGKRVVYSLGQHRVWLVKADGKASTVFAVAPSGVSPGVGRYAVQSRSEAVTGSDGVPIEHVVRFTVVNGVTIGFSAAVSGASPNPEKAAKTGGIREKRADGAKLWEFAPVGTGVVVVR